MKATGGSAGVDGVSLKEVERPGVALFPEIIAADLKAGWYQPQPRILTHGGMATHEQNHSAIFLKTHTCQPGVTPVMKAAASANLSAVKEILMAGGDVDSTDATM